MKARAGLIPCIISGGAGTRLWPVSRPSAPKPFIRMRDGQSLLQKAFLRASHLPGVERILTVTHRDLLFRTLDDYREVNTAQRALDLLLEPFGRNTATAIAVAALHIQEHFGADAQLLVMPADHLILDEAAFTDAVAQARTLAEAGYLVTFGIQPTRAETGFGYIERGAPLEQGCRVKRFVEKPDMATAQGYVEGGNHLWNAGMFCFNAGTVLEELTCHAPTVLEAARLALKDSQALRNSNCHQRELNAEGFACAPDISIDVALMEKSKQVAVVPCAIGWSDIGSWETLRQLTPSDAQGNQINGEAVVLHDVHGCYIDSPKRVLGAVGVRDLIIVDTPDALLIAHATRSQDVRHLVAQLKGHHHASDLHRSVTRPWGTYTVLEQGTHFKIKRLVVRPKASLSLQMHHHRSEHWVVVSGTAMITNGEREIQLERNESTYIPARHKHRLTNPGTLDLVMIEVQTGEYLGEDDIVRFDDIYGRVDEDF